MAIAISRGFLPASLPCSAFRSSLSPPPEPAPAEGTGHRSRSRYLSSGRSAPTGRGRHRGTALGAVFRSERPGGLNPDLYRPHALLDLHNQVAVVEPEPGYRRTMPAATGAFLRPGFAMPRAAPRYRPRPTAPARAPSPRPRVRDRAGRTTPPIPNTRPTRTSRPCAAPSSGASGCGRTRQRPISGLGCDYPI